MSTLISSATSGKKAAPKAPPRRRPGGPPAAPPKPAPKPVEEQPATESGPSQSQTGHEGTTVPPTPPATQQSPVRQTAEAQHVRFADPVTTQEHAPQPKPSSQLRSDTIPVTQNVVATTERDARSGTPASAQTGNQPQSDATSQDSTSGHPQQAPVLKLDALPGYTHVGGGTPPPAYSPDPEPTASTQTARASNPAPSIPVSGSPAAPSAVPGPTVTNSTINEVAASTESVNPTESPRSAAKRARPADPTGTESRARKAPKRNSTRSNATVQAVVEDASVPGPSQVPRRPPVARMMAAGPNPTEDATATDEANPEAQVEPSSVAPKKTPAKRKPRKVKTPARVNEEEPVEGEEAQEPAPKPKKPRKPRQKAPPKPRKKKATPVQEGGEEGGEAGGEAANAEEEEESDPEQHEIDPEALSMYNLTKSKRYGKTSEREKKMAEIDWDEVKRKRRAEAAGEIIEEQASDAQQKEQGANENGGEGTTAAAKEEAATRAVQGGVGFRVVNGEIVEDEETLQIDRRAQAQAEIAMQAPVEEENDLTRFHNRTTYMNDRKRDEKDRVPMWKAKSDPWSEDETDRFYDALKNWGTDFQIISQLFPGKTRAQIKKKFNREERLDAQRVNDALLGKDTVSHVRMDLSAYAEAANLDVAAFNKFDSLQHAQQMISESMKDKEEAMRVAVKEAEETERQRVIRAGGNKKSAEEKEQKKRENQAKAAARKKGQVWGAGTFGGMGGGGDEDEGRAEA